jgi:cyclic pyranopterin phosphate synthase
VTDPDGFTHLDAEGQAHMVDVGEKPSTAREARASGRLRMAPETLQKLQAGTHRKGDVLATARIAAIMGAKRTHELIPLCHSLPLSSVKVAFEVEGPDTLQVSATVKTTAQTGVEMEALTAVSLAALTVYDMCKAVDRGMVIEAIALEEKRGGASGVWLREGEPRA